jgi:hypothetical protein
LLRFKDADSCWVCTASVINECVWFIGDILLIRVNRITPGGGGAVRVPLFQPHISHGLTWDRTHASFVRGRWLTAWAMARPVPDWMLTEEC